MKCKQCKNMCIKKGTQKNKYMAKQRYFCKKCKKYQLEMYTYSRFDKKRDGELISLVSKGMSFSSVARHMGYSKQTIGRRVLFLANRIKIPIINERNQIYEVDEMWTYVGDKDNQAYIIFALNRRTKRVVSYAVGSRNKINAKHVIDTIKMLHPKKIVTDKSNIYPKIVSPEEHDTVKYRNNRIERANLTIREHIKRLSRKTISYSKSLIMLEATFKLFLFWNNWTICFNKP